MAEPDSISDELLCKHLARCAINHSENLVSFSPQLWSYSGFCFGFLARIFFRDIRFTKFCVLRKNWKLSLCMDRFDVR